MANGNGDVEQRDGDRTPITWSGMQRTFTRDERADMEWTRRRIALGKSEEEWADKELRDKAEVTARFLASEGATE